MTFFGRNYEDRRVLLTGHTGFKGSWLALWLDRLGAKITTIALRPETIPNHWSLLGLHVVEHIVDLRDAGAVERIAHEARPEIVFHLAAQSLVRRSYREPLRTWATNVMGTANLLEACRTMPGLRAIVVVTSDKCYENREWVWGYRETDSLGGYDPYSASKAAIEFLAASYRSAFFQDLQAPLLATARAGNVIGGGDWSEDRLIPDLVRAMELGTPLKIRYPDATRPWQHVLESLSGYLLLGMRLLEGRREFAEAWNFGPHLTQSRTVREVLARLQVDWPNLTWTAMGSPDLHEASWLCLDSTKARQRLQWQPVWGIDQTFRATTEWYSRFLDRGEVISRAQLEAYLAAAAESGLVWCR